MNLDVIKKKSEGSEFLSIPQDCDFWLKSYAPQDKFLNTPLIAVIQYNIPSYKLLIIINLHSKNLNRNAKSTRSYTT